MSPPGSGAMERGFQARMTQLADATAFVEAYCRRHDVGHHDLLRLTLMVEELFTNTVEHGHGGDCDAPIRLRMEPIDVGVALLYEDAAPPFDPLSVDAPDPDRVGGLGIQFVRRMALSVRYAREDGCNRLWIVFACAV